jgi:hypothetical protein
MNTGYKPVRIGSEAIEEEKAMIFHINRMTMRSGLSEEQRRSGLDMAREVGAANPVVRSFVVGREFGGEFEWSAVYVVDDLDGYWQYLEHPAHVHYELNGVELLERFEALDITDSDDPEVGEEIARLQVRHMEAHPDIAALVAQVPSFRVPDGSGQPAEGGGEAQA